MDILIGVFLSLYVTISKKIFWIFAKLLQKMSFLAILAPPGLPHCFQNLFFSLHILRTTDDNIHLCNLINYM